MTQGSTAAKSQSLIGDCAAAFMLLSRLPASWYHFPADNPPDFTSALWAFPVVGLVIGGCGGMVFWAAMAFSLPPFFAAVMALFVTLLLSGAMHEDGLADMADGFGGGHDTESKIRIMHDSHIGSYGVMALVLASMARAGLLVALAAQLGGLALVLLIALTHAAARFLPVMQLALVPVSPHAKLASLTGYGGFWRAVAGLSVWSLPFLLAFGWQIALLASAPACLLAVFVARMARRHVQGLTGDIMGATILLGEIVFLASCLVAMELLAAPLPVSLFLTGNAGG